MADLKVSQIAAILNCDKKSVYTLIQVGSLKSCKVGKHSIRVTPEELDRFRNEPVKVI